MNWSIAAGIVAYFVVSRVVNISMTVFYYKGHDTPFDLEDCIVPLFGEILFLRNIFITPFELLTLKLISIRDARNERLKHEKRIADKQAEVKVAKERAMEAALDRELAEYTRKIDESLYNR